MAPKIATFIFALLLAVSLGSCGQTEPEEPLKAVLVISGPLGNRAFNDSSQKGCDALVDK